MSAALLRRGLELLAASEAVRAAPGQAKTTGAPGRRTRRARAKASQSLKLRNSAKGKVPKSALAEYQKRQCRDHLKANLKFMTSVRSTMPDSVTQQILQQNQGRKACDRLMDKMTTKKKKKKAEGTVFTEEDFQKFQREYFGS
ncbi:active regulator of SIRT1 [Meriones unguiculatus]|uniref:active regulator of SIRT1 n=1 Tax=Meriones unguiculatus TaxID=10047 RepID=UPI000B4FB6EF|nr:active regulator of SIRT1 [Meriones unguiculatus]XP_021517813.1 active regulator of SIRT1-like [Meriones unguiculatus]